MAPHTATAVRRHSNSLREDNQRAAKRQTVGRCMFYKILILLSRYIQTACDVSSQKQSKDKLRNSLVKLEMWLSVCWSVHSGTLHSGINVLTYGLMHFIKPMSSSLKIRAEQESKQKTINCTPLLT